MKRIYISGPMRGYKDFNYSAFHEQACKLRHEGHYVNNPAENFDGNTGLPMEMYMREDMHMILHSDMIMVLPGWKESEGASFEVSIGRQLKLPIVNVAWGEIMIKEPSHGIIKKVWITDGKKTEDTTPVYNSIVDGIFADLSCKESITKDFIKIMINNIALFDLKQQRYGCGNIAQFGEIGVMIRANDKIQRLINLWKRDDTPKDETIEDTWQDLSVYGIIALMCRKGLWPGVTICGKEKEKEETCQQKH